MTPQTTPDQPRTISPHFVLVAAQLAVASAAIWARVGLAGGLDPVALAAWRLTVASMLLVIALKLRYDIGNAKNAGSQTTTGNHEATCHSELSEESAFTSLPHAAINQRDYAILLVAGVLLGIHFAAWFESLRGLPVGISTLLVATTPIWTGLYLQAASAATDRVEAPPGRFWLGLILAFAGIFALVPREGPLHASLWYGTMAVLGSVTIAGYLLIVQPIQPKLGSWRMVAWTYSFAAITMWPAAIVMSPVAGLIPHTTGAWTSIIGMALIPQLIGHTAINWSLRHFSAALVSAVTLCEPVFAAALAWWLLNEKLTAGQIVGGCLVLAGVAMAISKSRSVGGNGRGTLAGPPANEFAPHKGTKSTSVH